MIIKEKNYVSVVIYARNHEKTIRNLLTKIDDVFQNNFENYELVVVNDHSTDRTLNEIESVKDVVVGNLMIVNLAWRHGRDLAMFAGTDSAIGDFVFEVEYPNFFYHDDVFYKMYQAATSKGCDMVSASGCRSSRLLSRVFYFVLNKFSLLKLNLETEDLHLVTRRLINRVMESQKKIRYRKVLYKYSGFRSTNIRFEETHKKIGADSFWDKMSIATEVVLLFTNLGSQIGLFFALIFIVVSVSIGIYAVSVYFSKNIPSGWTMLMTFLSFGFSGVFLILGLVGKYVSMILFELTSQRVYTVASVERLNSK